MKVIVFYDDTNFHPRDGVFVFVYFGGFLYDLIIIFFQFQKPTCQPANRILDEEKSSEKRVIYNELEFTDEKLWPEVFYVPNYCQRYFSIVKYRLSA